MNAGGKPGTKADLYWAAIPYLIAMLPVSFAVQIHAIYLPRWTEIVLSGGIVLVFTAVFHGLARCFIPRSNKAEIIVALVVGYLCLAPFFVNLLPAAYQTLALPVLGIFTMIGVVVTCATRIELRNESLPGLTVAVLLSAISLQMISVASRVIPDVFRSNRSNTGLYLRERGATVTGSQIIKTSPETRLPHIYYIVLDAYGRSDVLKRLYGLDNSPFVKELEERGFVVGRQSRSNYHLTELSVASTLNLSYLNEKQLRHFRTRLPIYSLISDSVFVRTLKQNGYETVAFQSAVSTTDCRNFDRYISLGNGFSGFQDLLIHMTSLPALLSQVQVLEPFSPISLHRNQVSEAFEMLPFVTQDASVPTFVFAHIMAPHPPFAFDEQGGSTNVQGRFMLADSGTFHAVHDRSTYVDGYRRQLQYINSQVIRMLDRMERNSSRPVVFVIQGDHGPRSLVDVSNPNKSDLDEAFGILLAVATTQDPPISHYDSLTPVNVFRKILNAHFGTKLEMLDDKCYFESPIYSFKFKQVLGDRVEDAVNDVYTSHRFFNN